MQDLKLCLVTRAFSPTSPPLAEKIENGNELSAFLCEFVFVSSSRSVGRGDDAFVL